MPIPPKVQARVPSVSPDWGRPAGEWLSTTNRTMPAIRRRTLKYKNAVVMRMVRRMGLGGSGGGWAGMGNENNRRAGQR